MGFKRSVLFFVLVLATFFWGVTYALASPVLIKLQLEEKSDFEKAKALNVVAYHRFGDMFIAEFEKSNPALRDAGLTYQIIDEEPWTQSYYVISESPRCEKVDLSQYGRILVQTENFYFLKISDEGARGLAQKGYHIVKVFRHAIPLKYKPVSAKLPQVLPSGGPSIDSLISLISQDSLYAWTLRMQNFQTRYSYSDSIHRARQWLFNKFASFGIDSVWFHYYYYDSPQYNVVATVVGTAQPDKVIVVGGHYDSVVYGGGTNPYTWAPGADDNASGTVATLEMARIIAQNPLPVTVMFVPFAQEEQGLIGSDYFCNWLYYHYIDVHLMLNADMIGHSVDADPDVKIYAASSAMDFVNTMIAMADTYTYLNASYSGQSSGSDHYSFYQWGYDAVFSSEGDFFSNGWHKNYDIVDSLNFGYMKEVVKMDLATLVTVARTFGPQYVIGDANGDEMIDVADVIFLINYLFKNGPPPDPLERGDLTCNAEVNIEDVIFLINYLFAGGPEPPTSC